MCSVSVLGHHSFFDNF